MDTPSGSASPGLRGELGPDQPGLDELSLDELGCDEEAARIVARLARMDTEEAEPVAVAAFNSYI